MRSASRAICGCHLRKPVACLRKRVQPRWHDSWNEKLTLPSNISCTATCGASDQRMTRATTCGSLKICPRDIDLSTDCAKAPSGAKPSAHAHSVSHPHRATYKAAVSTARAMWRAAFDGVRKRLCPLTIGGPLLDIRKRRRFLENPISKLKLAWLAGQQKPSFPSARAGARTGHRRDSR
eukprot:scaffold759_cov119-Isochrysis_galbana.AAC.14